VLRLDDQLREGRGLVSDCLLREPIEQRAGMFDG
jgi:hypothetical protein